MKAKKASTECEITDLCFPVKMIDNPRKTNKEYSRVVVGVIDGEEMDLNYCSDVYTLVENESIFPNIEQVLFNNSVDFNVKYRHINHVRFYADYTITDQRYAYKMSGSNDVIYPLIRVQHSYNGLTKYRIVFGYFRMVCTNGLIIPLAEMNDFNLSISGKHTDSILTSFEKLDILLHNFTKNAKEITEKITRKYEVLYSRWIENPRERLEAVLKASKITVVENSKFNTLNDIMHRIEKEANMPNLGYNGKINDWLIYNGINQYINDDGLFLTTPEKRMEIDSNVFETMIEMAV